LILEKKRKRKKRDADENEKKTNGRLRYMRVDLQASEQLVIRLVKPNSSAKANALRSENRAS